MPITFKGLTTARTPKSEEPPDLPREGHHLKASWFELKSVGLPAKDMAIICGEKGDDIRYTLIAKHVNCPTCLWWIRNRLGYTLTRKQADILGVEYVPPPEKGAEPEPAEAEPDPAPKPLRTSTPATTAKHKEDPYADF